jgi:DNA-binding HxlR family transcriptional regulator
MRRTLMTEPCPVARSIDILGDRWTLLIVRDAFDGTRRFGDFQRNLGAARNILADRLSRLVEAGILAMQPASDGTSYQEYVLTDAGEALFPVVVALRQWGEARLFRKGEPRSQLVVSATGKPVPQMALMSADGHRIAPAETEVRRAPGTKSREGAA